LLSLRGSRGWLAWFFLQLREALDGGQHERRRLARTRRARHQQVAARDAGGDGALLDGRRRLVAGCRQRRDDLRRQTQLSERRAFSFNGLHGRFRRVETEGLFGDGVQRAGGIARSHENP
jgi:hypothetical protein